MNFPIPFTKMSGTGNDFIIIDHRQPFLKDHEIAAFAAKVCKRMFSVGADGLILIENHAEANFQWQFFNGDGSRAEMCGNGARCAARYAYSKGIAPATMSFMTVAGLIRAEVIGDQVKLEMTPPMETRQNLILNFGGEERTIQFSNTGVPHAVYFVESNGQTPVKEWGRELRMHHHFQPAGTNVNFAQITGPSSLKVRTYERGVEDETMACGTGAVAAALLGGLLGHVSSPVSVTSSGGEILTIYFDIVDREKNLVRGVFLEGPASFIYEGELYQEALR
ncbi:MAG: diaminopimelate epimerase [Proteobacteria bacterium]|nr:diaminopimelate epimerase [Pseudomonadota bacterium]MBU1641173.1 diaminopimelate epimerase [Pseudomonadota bacterium]